MDQCYKSCSSGTIVEKQLKDLPRFYCAFVDNDDFLEEVILLASKWTFLCN